MRSADAQPDAEELMRRGGSWSGENQQLWAKMERAYGFRHYCIIVTHSGDECWTSNRHSH
jgi:hypothetical protein